MITDLSANPLSSFAAQMVQNDTSVNPDDVDGDRRPNATDNCLDAANPNQANSDTDTIGDACDLDDDGNGLIEIRNLDMLNNMRNKLDGSAYNDGSSDNTTGCGNGDTVTTCSGYELVRDIDFSDSDSYASGSVNNAWRPAGTNPATAANRGWIPIGDNSTDNNNTRFTTTFDGNDCTITGLYVRHVAPASSHAYGGLFGYLGSGAVLRNTGMVAAAVFASSSGFKSAYAGGLVREYTAGSISNSYWDRDTVVLIESDTVVSAEDQEIGDDDDHASVTALTSEQMQATSGTYPDMLGADFNLGTTSEYPLLEYGGTESTDCKNSGDADLPVCGDLLPGQGVRMASGFLRFSNTAIGTPSSTDFVFFYDIDDMATSIAISGTGINGTTAGSYAIEDASGTALTGYSFSAISGSSTITLPLAT